VPFAICLHSVQQSCDTVWNAKSGGSREHVLHGNVDAATHRVWALLGVWSVSRNVREIWNLKTYRCKTLHFPGEICCALYISHQLWGCLEST